MPEVFSAKSLIYWWGILTASALVKSWLEAIYAFLSDKSLFSPSRVPFSSLPGLNSWVDSAADYFKVAIKFNSTDPVATITGGPDIPGWILAAFLGLLLLGLVVRFYIHALRTDSWLDDFIALFLIYVALRFEGHLIGSSGLPFRNDFRDFIQNPVVTFLLLIAFLFLLTFFGEGLRSKRAFWRALTEGVFLALLMFPTETASVLGRIVDALAKFGGALLLRENWVFAVLWGALGMILAIYHLTSTERRLDKKA